MQTFSLGTSDLALSPIGVGAWAMGGGGWELSAGPQDDQDSLRAIHRAIDDGINWIDTAPLYGLGHSEDLLGRALSGLSSRPYIFTKCGSIWDESGHIRWSLRANCVRQSVEDSLRRLKTDALDLCQIHQPRPLEQLEEGWATLAELKAEGKIRYIGVSNFTVAQIKRVQAIAPVTSIQPPYSMVARGAEESLFPFAQRHGLGVLVYSPMQSGLLAGNMTRERIANLPRDDSRASYPHFREPLLSHNLALVEVLRRIGRRHGSSPGEVAVAWTLRHPAVTAAIVGVRSPSQIDGLLGAASLSLTPAEVEEIEFFLRKHKVRRTITVRRIRGAMRRLLLGEAA